MLRLKKDLAEELNTNFIEEDDIFEELESSTDQSSSKKEEEDVNEMPRFSSNINSGDTPENSIKQKKMKKNNMRRLTAITEEEEVETESAQRFYSIKKKRN